MERGNNESVTKIYVTGVAGEPTPKQQNILNFLFKGLSNMCIYMASMSCYYSRDTFKGITIPEDGVTATMVATQLNTIGADGNILSDLEVGVLFDVRANGRWEELVSADNQNANIPIETCDFFVVLGDDTKIDMEWVVPLINSTNKPVHYVSRDGFGFCLMPGQTTWAGDIHVEETTVCINKFMTYLEKITDQFGGDNMILKPAVNMVGDFQGEEYPTENCKETTVFIGGSCDVDGLPDYFTTFLDMVMSANHKVVIGDAPGTDTMVQHYLHDHGYRDVVVYYTDKCRWNIGGWIAIEVVDASVKKEDGYWTNHMPKDIAMCTECTYGLFLWNMHSRATAKNFQRLNDQHKKFIVCYDKIILPVITGDDLVKAASMLDNITAAVFYQMDEQNRTDVRYFSQSSFYTTESINDIGRQLIDGFDGLRENPKEEEVMKEESKSLVTEEPVKEEKVSIKEDDNKENDAPKYKIRIPNIKIISSLSELSSNHIALFLGLQQYVNNLSVFDMSADGTAMYSPYVILDRGTEFMYLGDHLVNEWNYREMSQYLEYDTDIYLVFTDEITTEFDVFVHTLCQERRAVVHVFSSNSSGKVNYILKPMHMENQTAANEVSNAFFDGYCKMCAKKNVFPRIYQKVSNHIN